jgi:hypothetical protein
MEKKDRDWIKSSHVDLHIQVNGTWEHISPARSPGRLESFGYLPESKIYKWINGEFLTVFVSYNSAYAGWENPATRPPLQTQLLMAKEEELRPVYRQLHDFFRGNLFVSDNDLEAMGMPKRPAGEHTPVPPPVTIPGLDIERPSEGVVLVHFHDKGSTRRAKPHGVHGIEILWGVLDHAPASRDELTHSAFDTRTPYRFEFGVEEVGKHLYLYARWENTRGEKGPWSEVYHTMIS